jgi:SAM-dependent methyltransferase
VRSGFRRPREVAPTGGDAHETKWSLRRPLSRKRVRELYENNDYLDAYSQHTDLRVAEDFRAAVGRKWEQVGKLQFDFLVENDLQPHHRMLDIGCGTLRGGRHFIRYLDAGNYVGTDISAKAIEVARQLVEDEGLSEKHPRLLVSWHKNLRFEEFEPQSFDYLLAQSVFTHLKPEHIEECFRHVGRIMRPDASLFFTYYQGSKFHQSGRKTFAHPLSFFEALAEACGFDLMDRAADYPHPNGQRMLMVTPR